MYAAETGHILGVRVLLESFKDLGLRVRYIDRTWYKSDGFGGRSVTATNLAQEKSHTEIVALLDKFRNAK